LLRAEVELEKILSSNLPGTDSAALQIRERIAQAREGLRNTFAESEA